MGPGTGRRSALGHPGRADPGQVQGEGPGCSRVQGAGTRA